MTIQQMKNSIEKSYLSAFSQLNNTSKFHFCRRYFLLKDNLELKDFLKKYFSKKISILEKNSTKLFSDEKKAKLRIKLQKKLLKQFGPRKKMRWEFLEKNIEIFLIKDMVTMLYNLADFNLHTHSNYEEISKVIWTQTISEEVAKIILRNDEFLLKGTVYSINLIFYIAQLSQKSIDYTQEHFHNFLRIFTEFSSSTADSALQQSFHYGLTHFIIGESNFYKLKVSPSHPFAKYFLEYCEKHFNDIIKQNVDVLIEYGICYQIIGLKNAALDKIIHQKMKEKFNLEEGILHLKRQAPSKIQNFNRNEHTNVLALLYLEKLPFQDFPALQMN